MTAGTDGKTVDGIGMKRINALIARLKDFSYQPAPARRTYIPKANGKKRPLGIIIGSLGASLALSGNILGPILFFVLWNVIRMAFLWYTQEMGYKAGTKITEDASGGLLQKITRGASMMGMFVIGALIERWVTINFKPVVSSVPLQKGAYIDWNALPKGAEGIHKALSEYNLGNGMALDKIKETTLQQNLDSLIPGLAALLLTFLCMWLLKKKVSPIVIIIGIFVVGILGHVIGLL